MAPIVSASPTGPTLSTAQSSQAQSRTRRLGDYDLRRRCSSSLPGPLTQKDPSSIRAIPQAEGCRTFPLPIWSIPGPSVCQPRIPGLPGPRLSRRPLFPIWHLEPVGHPPRPLVLVPVRLELGRGLRGDASAVLLKALGNENWSVNAALPLSCFPHWTLLPLLPCPALPYADSTLTDVLP
jgi:hypothetical protein